MYRMKTFSSVFEVIRVIALVFITAILIRFFLFQPFVVEGQSMEPNYYNGEYLFVEKVSYRFNEPERGQVVVFHHPANTDSNYIKRIIGLPGETVRIENSKVYINGQELLEPYLSPDQKTVIAANPDIPYEAKVPEGNYFVLGDNRDHSSDSREGWYLEESQIIGRSALKLYSRHPSAVASPTVGF
jgi:signal peptidase I